MPHLNPRAAWALCALLALSCAGATEPPEAAPPAAPLRGIDFEPAISVVDVRPLRLGGTVGITNRRTTPARLTFPGECAARLRVYDRQAARNAPVWDQASDPRCAPTPVTLDLAPGETKEIQIPLVSAREILGDSLAAGEYRVTVYLEPDRNVVEVEVGTVELTTGS